MHSAIARSIIKTGFIARLSSFRNVSSSEARKVGFFATSKTLDRRYSTEVTNPSATTSTDNKLNTEERFSLPILPVLSAPMFPVLPSYVKIPEYHMKFINKLIKEDPYVGVFMVSNQKNKKKLINKVEDLCPVGVFAKIKKIYPDDNFIAVLVDRRVSITNLKTSNANKDVLIADVKNFHHEKFEIDDEMKALEIRCLDMLKKIIDLKSNHGDMIESHVLYMNQFIVMEKDPVFLCDFLATATSGTAGSGDLQRILEEPNVIKRLKVCLSLLKTDFEIREDFNKSQWAKDVFHQRPVEE